MNLKEFKFPTYSLCLPTDPKLLAEAKKRGFYNGNTPHNKLFQNLFFEGGKLNFKANVDTQFKNNVVSYFRAFAASFEPKHEEKEAICAMLLSEIVEA